MSVLDPIRFDGDNWTDDEKKSVSIVITKNAPYIAEPSYNRWTIYKYSDGHFYADRLTWDLGRGLNVETFDDLLTQLKNYYHVNL